MADVIAVAAGYKILLHNYSMQGFQYCFVTTILLIHQLN